MNIQSIQQRLATLKRLQAKLREDIDKEKSILKHGVVNTFLEKKAVPTENEKKNNVSEEQLNEKIKYLKVRDRLSDKNYFKKIKPLLDQIPDSNGIRYYNRIETNIGIISDEFLYNSYKDIANFFYIERENYKQFSGELDVLLIVSTWKGLNLEWKGLGNPNIKKHRQDLYKIIDFYRKQGTKIVFYSKEDPVNYHIFVDIAKQCDFIFTTAEEKIEDYKRDCNNENVSILEFGINPKYHNPIGIKKAAKQKEVLFTGSWYEKYPHRHDDTRMLFDGVLDANRKLKIIDRNFDLKLSQYFFPEEYLKYVSPSIEHSYLQKFHKIFDWAINLNTVKESNTMFANRVYELQALGNIMLSNYSVGVNNKFPNVFLINDKKEIKDIMNSFSQEEVFKHQVQGIRRVMSHETSFHRIEKLLQTVGISTALKQKKVAVVVNELSEQVIKMFDCQTYPFKNLVLEKDFTEEIKEEHDIIAFFDSGYFYGEFYLEDMVNGFIYTDCDYITKDAYYNGDLFNQGIEHDYLDIMKDKYRTVFWSNTYTLEEIIGFNGIVELKGGYSIDRFEFNSSPIAEKQGGKKDEFKLSVIVPAYNNGNHLLNKCFNSLKRSSLFNEMEIIIVDDGSTDEYTPKIINRLAREYSNVKIFFFNDGGSGSASRPRNKGFEISTSPFVTYLDPDNEAINDGYYHLLKEMEKGKFDLVVGNMLRLDTKSVNFDYYRTAVQFYGSDVITKNVKEYLVNTQFKAMSIQALIAKRSLIADYSLKMVEGAAGQDTIFFQELLLKSKKTKAINLPIHIYYAAVSGSTVNTITKRFFEKYLILEKYRVQMLRENNLIEQYTEKRLEYYVTNWYLNKLKKVNKEDAKDAIELLAEILGMYDTESLDSPEIREFVDMYAKNDYEDILKRFIG
ncbi:glycosyltransferase [Cytobacillus firmus]|uniref:glycosyltransferase n=1 Tax=Cytobacillus firmus TaxID=1399 RepID=UPI001CFF12D6|nr:glycosyltransferase [Cytobacillus firmus]